MVYKENLVDSAGRSPLAFACLLGRMAAAKYLVGLGAEMGVKVRGSRMHIFDNTVLTRIVVLDEYLSIVATET